MKRVGIAGFLHESNSFSPIPTPYQHFKDTSLTRGEALLERWQGTHHQLGGFLEGAREFQFEPVPLLATYGVPSAPLPSDSFEELAADLTRSLRAALPLDGLLVALHGAAVAENYPDADGELAARFRQVLGTRVPILAVIDLHANISDKMARNTNGIVVYRSNPHLDQRERGLEAAGLMARTLRGDIVPIQALERPPLLLNITRQYTEEAPAKELYRDVESVLSWPGILSASTAMGFYYSDVEEMGASFLAIADGDRELARKAARWLAERAWRRRREFLSDLPGPAEAVRNADPGTPRTRCPAGCGGQRRWRQPGRLHHPAGGDRAPAGLGGPGGAVRSRGRIRLRAKRGSTVDRVAGGSQERCHPRPPPAGQRPYPVHRRRAVH